jgi:wobble nucleotide-excising tRNase
MTKEQFEHWERMEAAGGPKSQAEAMLYHQYKQQKQQLEDARKAGKEQFQSEILKKLLEVQRLERSIEKLKGQLQNEKLSLENMTKTLVLLGDEL